MSAEQINKIKDIEGIEYKDMDKADLSNLCDLILGVWELEDDAVVKDAIAQKLNDVVKYIITQIPD